MRIRLANPYLAETAVRSLLPGGPTETRFPMNNDGGEGDDGGGGGSGGDGSEDGDEDEDEDDEEDQESSKSKDKSKSVSREELEAVLARMKAADRRASQAEARLKEIGDKDKSELEKATERVSELEEQNKALTERLRFADLRDAFANVDGFKWRKAGAALKLARSEGYLDDVFGEDGEVDQKKVSKKVKEFAEANDYLLDTDKDGGTPPPSGTPTGSGSRRKPAKEQEDANLRKRYPILGR